MFVSIVSLPPGGSHNVALICTDSRNLLSAFQLMDFLGLNYCRLGLLGQLSLGWGDGLSLLRLIKPVLGQR